MNAHRVAHDAAVAPPGRRLALVIPVVVALAIGVVLAWSAWPVVRPVRTVSVVQAVYEPSTAAAAPEQEADTPRAASPTVQAAGWLEADPFYVACTSLADGILESIEVLEGDYVEQGDVVGRLVAEDSEIRLRRAEAALAAARAALADARAEHDAARVAWEEPVELDRRVASGEAALAESRAELARLPSLIASARATYERLAEEAEQVRMSADRGGATSLEVVIAEQRAVAQRAEMEALEARVPVLEARIDRLSAELRAARRDLDLRIEDRRRLETTAAAVERARASVDLALAERDEAALELERMVIRAPISGYVQRRLKVPGDKVIRMMDSPESTHLLHLYDPERIQVRVDVPLADASHVFVGQRCEVVVEVLPDRVFEGEVLRTTHEADLQKNTLEVKVKVLDPEPILRPEMLTRVKFLPPDGGAVGSAGDGAAARVLVPREAIDTRGGASRVWLVTNRRNGRGELSPRAVEVVGGDGAWATVAGEVGPGALLAVGLGDPREGEAVAFVAAGAGEGQGG